jgi:hypothetical protein
MFTSRGKTCEKAGSNNTSSNVSPSPKNFFEEESPAALDDLIATFDDLALLAGEFILAMCKDSAADKYAPNFCQPRLEPDPPKRIAQRADLSTMPAHIALTR